VSRETSQDLLGLLPLEAAEYLAAVMAPCATGENISRAEYLAMVAAICGRAFAEEMAAAILHFSVTVPGSVTLAGGGRYSGSTAVFEIPLLDILVLDRQLRCEVRWN
jgi:hypothetical protein